MLTSDKITPVVGMGTTIVMFSDRFPAQVVRVSKSGKTCWIREVLSKIVSGSEQDGSATYEYGDVDPSSTEIKVYKSKAGSWRVSGSGRTVWLGKQRRYYDPHF